MDVVRDMHRFSELKGEGDKHSEGEISYTDFLEQCAPFHLLFLYNKNIKACKLDSNLLTQT